MAVAALVLGIVGVVCSARVMQIAVIGEPPSRRDSHQTLNTNRYNDP